MVAIDRLRPYFSQIEISPKAPDEMEFVDPAAEYVWYPPQQSHDKGLELSSDPSTDGSPNLTGATELLDPERTWAQELLELDEDEDPMLSSDPTSSDFSEQTIQEPLSEQEHTRSEVFYSPTNSDSESDSQTFDTGGNESPEMPIAPSSTPIPTVAPDNAESKPPLMMRRIVDSADGDAPSLPRLRSHVSKL